MEAFETREVRGRTHPTCVSTLEDTVGSVVESTTNCYEEQKFIVSLYGALALP